MTRYSATVLTPSGVIQVLSNRSYTTTPPAPTFVPTAAQPTPVAPMQLEPRRGGCGCGGC